MAPAPSRLQPNKTKAFEMAAPARLTLSFGLVLGLPLAFLRSCSPAWASLAGNRCPGGGSSVFVFERAFAQAEGINSLLTMHQLRGSSKARWNGQSLRSGGLSRVARRGKGALHNQPTGGTALDQETVVLHKRYHDATVDYTVQNFQWVQDKHYASDSLLSRAEQQEVWQASRERLFRWPRIEPRNIHDIPFGAKSPQRFCEGDDAKLQTLGDPGEHVYVINLPRRPAKLRHVLHGLHSAGISAKVVDAIDGDAFVCQQDMEKLGVSTLPNYIGHQNTLPYLTSGQLGCFMSHYAIWHHMVEHNIPSALILEDDFDLQENFAQRLGEYLEEAHGTGEDWNLLYLGRSPTEGDWRTISEHIVEPGYTLWTVAYIMRLDAAKAFVDAHVERELAPLDHYFSVSMGKGLDLHWNDQALEWARYIPRVLRGLAVTPPLVMPYVGSMFLSDTAMLRNGTKYMKDLPLTEAEAMK